MVSSTSALSMLPVCSDHNDSPPAGNLDAVLAPEDSLSFASRLDQRRSQSEPDKASRRPQSRLRNVRPDAQETQSGSEIPNSPEAVIAEAADRPANAEPTDEDSGKSGDSGDKDQKDGADKAASTPPPIAPLTPDALNSPAFLAALTVSSTAAVLPTAAPTITPVALSNSASVIPVADGNSAANGNPALPTAPANPTPTGANAANVALVTSTVSPIIPTVAMDSRAVPNTTPGVDNAFPLPSSLPSAPTLNALPPANALPVTNANANIAATITPDVLGGTIPNIAAPGENTSIIPTAQTGGQNNSAAVLLADNLGGTNAAIVTPIAAPSTLQLPTTPPVSIARQANVAAPANGDAEAPVIVVPADSGAQSTVQPSAAVEQQAAPERDNAPALPDGKQNLGGIERLLTLSNAKTAPSVVEDVPKTETANSAQQMDTAPQPDAAQGISSLPPRLAAGNTIAARPGVPAVNAAQSGTPAPIASTGAAQPAMPVASASINLDSAGKAGTIAQALHGPPGVPQLNRAASAAAFNSQSGSGIAGDSRLVSFAQASTLARGEAGEQEGQDGSQWSANEQGFASEPRTANAADSASSASFAVTRASEDTPAAVQSTSTANSGQIDRAHVVEQVTRHLETMRLTNDNGEMRLRLNPHNLGSVQVTIAAHQDGVVARIAVESAQVQQVMEGAKEHLRAGLEARGLRVQSVEVTVTPNMLGDNAAAFSGQRNWQSTGAQDSAAWQPGYGRRSAPHIEVAPIAAPAAITSRAALSDSRLDCRA